MSLAPRQAARRRPAAVAVHDDRHMTRRVPPRPVGIGLRRRAGRHARSCRCVRSDLGDLGFLGRRASGRSRRSSRRSSSGSGRPSLLLSSSLMSPSFSSFLRWSRPSRRTWRTATRACSAYLCATLTSSWRRSALSSGIGMRRSCPSTIGLRPRLASRMARSTACTVDRSQTWTESMRGSGTLIVATWLIGIEAP